MQVLGTEISAVTIGIPAGLIGDQSPRTVGRAQARPPMSNAAKAGICVVIAVATMAVAVFVAGGFALMVFVPFYVMALLAAGAQVLSSRHEKRSRGQLPPRPGPSTGLRSGAHRGEEDLHTIYTRSASLLHVRELRCYDKGQGSQAGIGGMVRLRASRCVPSEN